MSGTLKVGGKTLATHDTNTNVSTLTADEANVGSNALVVDSSGNVGVGTTSPSNLLHVKGAVANDTQGVIANFDSGNLGVGSGPIVKWTNVFVEAAVTMENTASGASALTFQTMSSSTLSEQMRIDSSGNLLVNASSFQGGSTVGIQLNATNNASNAYAMLIKNSDGSEIFQFKCNGSASSSAGTWGSISDINLKENIIDATNKLSDVLKLKVKNFNFKSDSEKTKYIGFIAQELETIFPNLVEEGVDGIKSVKTSILIPILTKAIQEQQALIESQQSQIYTLTAKTQEQDFTIASLISRIEALEAN